MQLDIATLPVLRTLAIGRENVLLYKGKNYVPIDVELRREIV
jgi:hypothetical protein